MLGVLKWMSLSKSVVQITNSLLKEALSILIRPSAKYIKEPRCIVLMVFLFHYEFNQCDTLSISTIKRVINESEYKRDRLRKLSYIAFLLVIYPSSDCFVSGSCLLSLLHSPEKRPIR